MSGTMGISVTVSEPAQGVAAKLAQLLKNAKKITNSEPPAHKYMGMQEKINVLKFLKHLNEKNYAQAHKYLKSIMEQKLMNRINKNKNVRVF